MLETLLRDEWAAVEALTQHLRREYEILKTRDVSGLEQVVHEKAVCAEHLRVLIAKRLDYLREQGFATGREGLVASIAGASPALRDALARLAADLEQAAEQARTQNEVNGAVIAASRGYVERALTILSGRDSLDFLYDQETRKVFGGGNSPIAKA